MVDLPDEDPDAAHKGEFIVTVLRKVSNRNYKGLRLTYHGGFQACGVCDRDKGSIQIIQVDLAFCLEFVNEIEQLESEHHARLLPHCGKPPCMHELCAMEIRGTGSITEAVGDMDSVDPSEVKECKHGWDLLEDMVGEKTKVY